MIEEMSVAHGHSIEDITGAIWCLVADIELIQEGKTPEFPIGESLSQLDGMLRDKIRRTRNDTVSQWFRRGYDDYALILRIMGSPNPDLALVLEKMRSVEDLFVHGNKANRRTVDFIVGEGGDVTPVDH
jgi:hypothetical protein